MAIDDFELVPPPREPDHSRDDVRNKAAKHRARTIDVMRRRHGAGPEGATCQGCANLVRSGGGDGTFPKCSAFRISCSEATDWRLRWPACGKFTPRESEGRV